MSCSTSADTDASASFVMHVVRGTSDFSRAVDERIRRPSNTGARSPWALAAGCGDARLEKGGDLTILGKVLREPSRRFGRVRHVLLPDLHIPQREFGFRVGKKI